MKLKKQCMICHKTMMVSDAFKNAEVSHLACAMKATKEIRKFVNRDKDND